MPSYPGKWRGTHQAKAHVTMRQRRRRCLSRRRGFSFPHPASAASGGWEPDARDAPCAARDVVDPSRAHIMGMTSVFSTGGRRSPFAQPIASDREFPKVSTS
jgi:hypothetical protein